MSYESEMLRTAIRIADILAAMLKLQQKVVEVGDRQLKLIEQQSGGDNRKEPLQ